MDALLAALVALMALAAAMAAAISTLSRAAVFALLAITLWAFRYRRALYIIIRTLPRDCKFLYRYAQGMIRSKIWGWQNATVAQLFTQRAEREPNAPCFIVNEKTWTFQEMAHNSNRVARVLQAELDLRLADVVCVLMPNSGEFVWTWLGVAKLGGVSALLNSNLRFKPLLHCIQAAKPKAIIFSDTLYDSIAEIRSELSPDIALLQLGGDTCDAGVVSLDERMAQHPQSHPRAKDPTSYRDTLLYIYTSGTTGMPKAAVLPNSKYLLVVVATVHMLGLKSKDRVYNPLPLYHTAGGVVGTGAALVDGIPSVLRAKFSASNYWADCIKYRCTVAQYIGEMCRYLLAQPARPADTQHNVRIMVGNGMRTAIWQQIVDRFKVPQINEIYGATEGNANIINVDNTVGAVGFMPSLVPVSLLPMALVRANELGVPIRGQDGFCIRCKPSEPGMFIGLIAQGNASREYHGYVDKQDSNTKLIKDVFRKGDAAFVSGDILVMDELGYLYFRDRTGDTYKWKGENVATAEVEDAMSAVLDNRALVVYGVSVPNMEGRAGMAAIADPEKKLDLSVLAKSLDDALPFYARPVFLRIVDVIEITGTFKLKKLEYQREGFDPEVIRDPLFVRLAGRPFEPLTVSIYHDILAGKVKL